MDQGIAAVIAAGFGLIGAAIGGGAAIWGAKVGAENAAAAQARHEHMHWLRQHRLDLFTQALSQLDVVSDFLNNFNPYLFSTPAPERLAEEWDNVRSTLDPIREIMNKLSLLTEPQSEDAPFAAITSALQGISMFGTMFSEIQNLNPDTELTPELEQQFSELWRISEEVTSRIGEFKDASARLLATPT
ncbi:hypothetical protein ACWDSL_35320 [Streptomyces sp. NPDC000941]